MANEKHIFIGIGGSGCQTVSQIKAKVYEKRFPEATASKTRLQAMNDCYRFLFIDTDQRDIDEANKNNHESFEGGMVPFISPQTDLINLGRANPQAIYYEAKNDPSTLINKRITEACSPELAVKIPDQPLAFGAGAFRMKSRIAFAHALTDFQSKLQAAISSLNDVKTVGGNDCIIYYWVVGSTLGGTGSGIFNDVLYHINQIHHQVVGNGDPQLVLTMYMPKVYIDSNATEEKYTLNAYGVFSELSAFKKMSYSEKQNTVMHRLAFQNDYSLIDSQRRYCPFYYLIPVDIQTDKGTSLGTTRTMYHNTAEMLYHLHYGKGGATFRSDIDNYMNDIMERNHENFLVPMGYVSLQKPEEQFSNYIRSRFKRDILRNFLLCDTGKEAVVDELDIPTIYEKLFDGLNDVEKEVHGSDAERLIKQALGAQDKSDELVDKLYLENIKKNINRLEDGLNTAAEKKSDYKKKISDVLWTNTESLVLEHGLTYAISAVEKVRTHMKEQYDQEDAKLGNKQGTSKGTSYEKQIKEIDADLQSKYEKALDNSKIEKIGAKVGGKGNKTDIDAYTEKLNEYVKVKQESIFNAWFHDIKKDFCADESSDELTRLKKHLSSLRDKVAEMNRDAVKSYNGYANKLGESSMDVTTVYLPMLKNVCDGNGWIVDNFFSRLYTMIIEAQLNKEETASRKSLYNFLKKGIYDSTDEKLKKLIHKGEYITYTIKKSDEKEEEEKKIEHTNFFANNNLDRNSEKIVEDFINFATAQLEKAVSQNTDIQNKWYNRSISAFFSDLTNEEKDAVRQSLNPALFFNYNSNRIEVTKKEEHIVFIADNEDLAMEMLGYQKGNPKHRFERGDDSKFALVIKSKYGLSLKDYRMFDAIKAVYDKATFREKYHFHHEFAQFKDKLTIEDLPDEILPQHIAFAKILLLDMYKENTAPLFYSDKYDDEEEEKKIYRTSMYIPSKNSTIFKIARPEAFSISEKDGSLVLKMEENEHSLYDSINGTDFCKRFEMFKELFYNHCYGETVDNIIQAILRQNRKVEDKTYKGSLILEDNYEDVHDKLLDCLNTLKKESPTPEEKRLYGILFNVVRNNFDTYNNFIK